MSPRFSKVLSLSAGLVVGTLLSSFSATAEGNVFETSAGAEAPSPVPGGVPLKPIKAAPIVGFLADLGDEDEQTPVAEEASPEDTASEFGLPNQDGEGFGSNFRFSRNVPQNRVVSPSDFGKFDVTVDVFRRSMDNPVLGRFDEAYINALVPDLADHTEDERLAEAKKRFASLAAKEIAILSVHGELRKAYIISGALEQKVSMVVKGADGKALIDPATGRALTRKSMKTTPPGNYRLDPLAYGKNLKNAVGKTEKVDVAYPWIRSQAYQNSQMFWGIWIKGGYFIHSTPHYGELGRPASMGCIRQSFPDSIDLFKLLVDQKMSGMIRIHRMGSDESLNRFSELMTSPDKDVLWILSQLRESSDHIRGAVRYYGTDVSIKGHAWMDELSGKPAATAWPVCGAFSSAAGVAEKTIDCFSAWGVAKPKNSLN